MNLEKQYKHIYNMITRLKYESDFWNDYFGDFHMKDFNLEEMRNYYHQLKPITKKEIINNYDSYVSRDFLQCFSSREEMLERVFDVSDLSGNHDKSFINRLTGEKWYLETTTGSTGHPFPVVKSQKELLIESKYLAKQRRNICAAADLRTGFLMIHQIDPFLKQIDYRGDDLSSMETLYEYMVRRKPKWIFTTALLLKKYVSFLLSNGINIKEELRNLEFIEVTSQTLDENEKRQIEELFGAKIVRQYGSREFWCIGYDNEIGELKCNNDYLLVDVLNEKKELIEKNDEEGDIVITSLSNCAMPFFKYYLGDVASIHINGNGEKIINLAAGRKCERLTNTKYFGNVVFRKVLRRLYFHEGIRDIINIRIVQSDNFVLEVYVEKKLNPDMFFEKRFVEISKFIIEGIDKFVIIFHYEFPFVENDTKDQVFISTVENDIVL